jgi:hypothetical protein
MSCSGCVAGDQPAALSRAVRVYATAARMQGRQTGAAFRRHCTAARSPMTPWSDEETRDLVAEPFGHPDRQAPATPTLVGIRKSAPVAPGRPAGRRHHQALRGAADADPAAARQAGNPHHVAKAGAGAQRPGAAARDAAVLADRARRRALSLAARRGAEGRDDVLRRRGGAKAALLRAPPAERAWPGQRILTFGAILAACRFH